MSAQEWAACQQARAREGAEQAARWKAEREQRGEGEPRVSAAAGAVQRCTGRCISKKLAYGDDDTDSDGPQALCANCDECVCFICGHARVAAMLDMCAACDEAEAGEPADSGSHHLGKQCGQRPAHHSQKAQKAAGENGEHKARKDSPEESGLPPGVERLLAAGPGAPVLPEPQRRRYLRELWGTSLAEAADALGVDPEEMVAWETGTWEPEDVGDQRAYRRLLYGFQHAMPPEYEPDWAALRPPQHPPAAPTSESARTVSPLAPTTSLVNVPSSSAPLWTSHSGDQLRWERRFDHRRVTLHGEIRDSERMEISLMVCDAEGEIVGELDGEAAAEDLTVLAQLLQDAARTITDPASVAPSSPTAAAPPARGARWSEDDHKRLTDLFRAGRHVEELAAEFGRSEKAIRWKLYQLKLGAFPDDLLPAQRTPAPPKPQTVKAYSVEDLRTQHPNSHKRWESEDDELLAQRCEQGATIRELSEEFGRNEGGIRSRLIKIDAKGPAADQARSQA